MSTRAFEPTLLRSDGLCLRLASELQTLNRELQLYIIALQKDPKRVVSQTLSDVMAHAKRTISAPNVLPASAFAIVLVASLAIGISVLEKHSKRIMPGADSEIEGPEVTTLSFPTVDAKPAAGIDGKGRVGINRERGEGSSAEKQRSGGGGSGGNGSLTPPSVGKLPSPSLIPAAIPTSPPIKPAALPVAGIDLDPALFRDVKFPVYGDPRSKTEVSSNGSGTDGGIGNNRGTGVGEGKDGGFGPGEHGNTGGGRRQPGCCGSGSSDGGCIGNGCFQRPMRVGEADTRPRVISKPEPQYTEEARRNQMMGTVILRVVFSSTGEVTQIQAIKTLPFGLTEKAIAAARRINFMPARKGGSPVSVYMQLEYNFNLY